MTGRANDRDLDQNFDATNAALSTGIAACSLTRTHIRTGVCASTGGFLLGIFGRLFLGFRDFKSLGI
jgi:hypothetical protein